MTNGRSYKSWTQLQEGGWRAQTLIPGCPKSELPWTGISRLQHARWKESCSA